VIINTSFNVRGEPIVCTPADAYRVFRVTNMDVLVLGNCILLKEMQADAEEIEIEEHLAQFALD
jgi:carbamoyltransferase